MATAAVRGAGALAGRARRRAQLRAALGAALLLALAFAACVFGWFADAIAAYTGASLGVAWLVLLLLAPLLEPQLFVFVLARRLARSAGAVRCAALAGAYAWVGAEWALPKLFADSLGHGFLPAPWLRQAADLAGVGGPHAGRAARERVRAGGVARALDGAPAARRARTRRVARRSIGALALYGALRLRALEAEMARAPRVSAGIVQADIARYGQLARELGSEARSRAFSRRISCSRTRRSRSDPSICCSGPRPSTRPPSARPRARTARPSTARSAPSSADGHPARVRRLRRRGRERVQRGDPARARRRDGSACASRPTARQRCSRSPSGCRRGSTRRALRKRLPWLGSWSPPESGAHVPTARARRAQRARRAAHLLRRARPGARARGAARGRRADRHPLERRVVRVRRRAAPAPRDGGLPHASSRAARSCAPRPPGSRRWCCRRARSRRSSACTRARHWWRACRCSRGRRALRALRRLARARLRRSAPRPHSFGRRDGRRGRTPPDRRAAWTGAR